MKRIPVVICIDIEPKPREIGRDASAEWEGVSETIAFFRELRPRIERVTGAPAHFSWFLRMDPQVAQCYGRPASALERYGDRIEDLEREGDELGLHTHAWRWDPRIARWIADHGDRQWVEHCLAMSFDTYAAAFGRACRVFRFGDRWMDDATMRVLESLGVRYDLTVEPGMFPRSPNESEIRTGSFPDYTRAPRWPYRPARRNFTRPSRSRAYGLWEIPVSTGRPSLGRAPSLKRAALAAGIDPHRRYEPMTLNLSFEPRAVARAIDVLLTLWRRRYLAPVLRSDAGADPAQLANVAANLEFLLSHPLAQRLAFVTPGEALDLMR